MKTLVVPGSMQVSPPLNEAEEFTAQHLHMDGPTTDIILRSKWVTLPDGRYVRLWRGVCPECGKKFFAWNDGWQTTK